MKQLQQIKGYGHQQPAHTTPLATNKSLLDKQPRSQSLIDKCLKSIVKEKLTGCLINAERKKREHESTSTSTITQLGLNSYLNCSVANHRYARNPEQPSNGKSITNKRKIRERNPQYLSPYQSTMASLHWDRQQENIVARPRGDGLAFISAVEHGDEEVYEVHRASLNLSPNTTPPIESLKLPKIHQRTSTMLSPPPILKTHLKKQTPPSINTEFWNFLTSTSAPLRVRRNSTSISDIPSKDLRPSLGRGSTTPASTKHKFYAYVEALPFPFRKLLGLVLQFFQVRLPQDFTSIYYSGLLEELRAVHERAWAMMYMAFWDHDQDGLIQPQDIFQLFKQLHQFDQNSSKVVPQALPQPPQRPPSKIRHIRNSSKQHLTSIQQIANMLEYYRPRQDEGASRDVRDAKDGTDRRDPKQEMRERVLGLGNVVEAVKMFDRESQSLNQLLSGSTHEQIEIKQLLHPVCHPIQYLQQILLYTPQFNYKNMLPLISIGQPTGPSPSPSTSQFCNPSPSESPNPYGARSCTSYLQCFISTQHNEETRVQREQIQMYKHQLRTKRHQYNRALQDKLSGQAKLTKQIGYFRVVTDRTGQLIKDIVMGLLGGQE